jgi:hypothetical protein
VAEDGDAVSARLVIIDGEGASELGSNLQGAVAAVRL